MVIVSFMALIRRCGGDGEILLSQRDDATVYCSINVVVFDVNLGVCITNCTFFTL